MTIGDNADVGDDDDIPDLRCGFSFLRRLGWITTGRWPAWQWHNHHDDDEDEDGHDDDDDDDDDDCNDLNNGDDAGDHDNKVWQLPIVSEATCKCKYLTLYELSHRCKNF